MKNIVLIIIIVLLHTSLFGQVVYNDVSFFKKINNFKITKKKNVTDEAFRKGEFIFRTTKKGLKTAGDYANLAVALSYLGEDKDLIKYSFKKALSLDTRGVIRFYRFLKNVDSTEYIKRIKWFPIIKDKLLELEVHEKQQLKIHKGTFNIDTYCKKNEVNINLVKLIYSINRSDQKYRLQDYKKNLAKQNKLDSLNLSKIDSLYAMHNTYIGKSLVGDKFSHVMWAVIQHSNIEKMEEYLPILLEAVKNKELKLNPVKMLIDRIHTAKCGNQIFGSQIGVDMAKEKVRKKIIAKYGIDSLEKL